MTAKNFMLTAKEKQAKKMLQNAAKCSKNMVFPTFLDVDRSKIAALTLNLAWTHESTLTMCIPNFRLPGHREICLC